MGGKKKKKRYTKIFLEFSKQYRKVARVFYIINLNREKKKENNWECFENFIGGSPLSKLMCSKIKAVEAFKAVNYEKIGADVEYPQ